MERARLIVRDTLKSIRHIESTMITMYIFMQMGGSVFFYIKHMYTTPIQYFPAKREK